MNYHFPALEQMRERWAKSFKTKTMKLNFYLIVMLVCTISSAQSYSELPQQTKIVKREISESQKVEFQNLIDVLSKKIESGEVELKDYEERAKLYLVLQQHKKAIADYDLLITEYPIKASYYYYRGLNYLSDNNLLNACEDFEKAKTLNYDFSGGELMLLCN